MHDQIGWRISIGDFYSEMILISMTPRTRRGSVAGRVGLRRSFLSEIMLHFNFKLRQKTSWQGHGKSQVKKID